MKIIEYKNKSSIYDYAKQIRAKVYETRVSYSFRIFDERGMTKEIHIFKK